MYMKSKDIFVFVITLSIITVNIFVGLPIQSLVTALLRLRGIMLSKVNFIFMFSKVMAVLTPDLLEVKMPGW